MPQTPPPNSSAPLPAAPSAPPGAAENGEALDDFASLLAASWFTLTPPGAPAPQTAEVETAGAVSTEGGDALTAAPLANLALTEQSPPPAVVQLTPAGEALPLTTAAGDAAQAQMAGVEGLTAAQRAERLASLSVNSKGTEVSTVKTDFLKSLQTAAAERDLVSVASTLAEATRQTRSPLTTSSLKSFLGEHGASEMAAPEGMAGLQGNISAAPASLQAAGSLREVSSPEATQQVVNQIIEPMTEAFEKLARHESRTLHLRLNPEALGQVDVHLTRHGDGKLTAHLMAEHESARRALHDGLGHLREALEQAGLAVERLDVTVGFNLNAHTGSFSRQPGEMPSDAFPANGGRSFQPEADEAAETNRAVSHEDRIVSLRA